MTQRTRTLRKMEFELERLKRILNLGYELEIRWLPGQERRFKGERVLGEVIGKTIFIYAESGPKAMEVLKHEFIEYALTSEFTAPYNRMINALIAVFEKEVYQRKERLVKRLSGVI